MDDFVARLSLSQAHRDAEGLAVNDGSVTINTPAASAL
jgi:hypothetical protein